MCLNKLSLNEMNEVRGGGTAELIEALWNACPKGYQLTVTNQDDGTFAGTRTCQSGGSMALIDSVLAVGFDDGRWGVNCRPIQ